MSDQNVIGLFSFTGSFILATLLLPLLSFVVSSLIRERYEWAVGLIASLLMMVAAIFAAVALAQRWSASELVISLDWFSVSGIRLNADLILSRTSLLMFFTVMLISFLVHLYSIGYMAADKASRRYFAMLGFFTFSMQGIVLANSLLVVFVFWELVGFSSYLLIGHHMERPAAARASKKAFLMNRAGDIGFIIGLMIVWANAGTFDMSVLSQPLSGDWQTAASLCFFCGVIGKSAQFPLLSWLPDAMEGPTPVSALIHAATMVAAGVYLLVRVFPLFPPFALQIVSVVGIITALVAAASALTQTDIKRILAYSTISQLGLMVTAVGAGAPDAAFLHLFTHAFFKACLFLAAGSVIFNMHQAQLQSHVHFDVQDIRQLGALWRRLPATTLTFVISGASLAGLPLFSGFLSKEAILTHVWNNSGDFSGFHTMIFILILVLSFLTVLYTFRLVWLAFFARAAHNDLPVRESALVMRIPMTILALGSFWITVSINPFDFEGWIVSSPTAVPATVTVSSFAVLAMALGVGWWSRNTGGIASATLQNVFYIDRFYRLVYARTFIPASAAAAYVDKRIIDRLLHLNALGNVTLAHVIQWIDSNVVDGIVSFVSALVRAAGFFLRRIQGGKVQLYVFWAVFTIIIFLIWTLN